MPRERATVRCSRCGTAGHNARTCRKTADADPEEEPRHARSSRHVDLAEERVIPHAVLVAMLAADRAQNAVGDAGGYLARADRDPSLVGPAVGTREVCYVHGWVGRHAFERDNHAACDPVGEPCAHCGGSKVASAHFCDHCGGTGVEPPRVGAVVVPPRASTLPIHERHRRGRSLLGTRATTVPVKRLTRAMLAEGAKGLEVDLAEIDLLRPKTRADCIDGPRPCPWVGCRYHLALDVNPETGSIKFVRPDREPWEVEHSCALDLADEAHTLEQVGAYLNVTRERLRQIEVIGLHKLKASDVVRHGIGPGDFTERGEHPLAEVEQ